MGNKNFTKTQSLPKKTKISLLKEKNNKKKENKHAAYRWQSSSTTATLGCASQANCTA
jgi:hypothetical protein